jgi:LmbE family N-acetylglucosaminyl deacetylase
MENLFNGKRPISLYSVQVPKNLRILSFAPHPDDFDEIGITMRFFKDNGNPIHVCVIGSGVNGVDDSFCISPTLQEKSKIRENEQRRSIKFFGLPKERLTFLHLQQDRLGHPKNTEVNFQKTKDFFLSIRPDFVLLPHGNDSNSSHRRAFNDLQKIAAQTKHPFTALLNRDPKTIDMRIDIYTPFGEEESKWKKKLLRFHNSQQQRNLKTRGCGFDQRILNFNRQLAKQISKKFLYTEAFELKSFNSGQLQ